MDHVRKLIRHACVEKLKGATDAGDRVFPNRASIFFGYEYPYISIFTLEESSRQESISGVEELRKLQLAIDVYASVTENLDDELDDHAKVIEDLMDADDALGGHAINCELKSTAMDLASMGDAPYGVVRLIYDVSYLA